MNAIVLEKFQDKYTKKVYKKGDVIKNITKKRFDEILEASKKPLIKKEEPKETTESEPAAK